MTSDVTGKVVRMRFLNSLWRNIKTAIALTTKSGNPKKILTPSPATTVLGISDTAYNAAFTPPVMVLYIAQRSPIKPTT